MSESVAAGLWGGLSRDTMLSVSEVASGSYERANHPLFLRISDVCSVCLGGSVVRRNGSVVVVEVRIEKGRGRSSSLDYTHVVYSDTGPLGDTLSRAEAIGKAALKEVLLSTVRDVAHVVIGECGIDEARAAFNTAVVEDVMGS